VTPVIRGADALSVAEIAEKIRTLAAAARANKLKPEDFADGTYTISNSGGYGTLFTASIINQPQVAILSTDGVKRRPVAVETAGREEIGIRPVGVLAQSFDHRAFDGAYSAAFLKKLKDEIETRDWTAALG
jgi:pyruvate/2-oxoglutarate dehydrogenase complex dihydrolipoamide acyltransferase (E2) component